MVWKLIRITMQLIIYVGQGLCKNKVLHRCVCIVFWPNPPIMTVTQVFSSEARPTLWSCYANISVFIDRIRNKFLKK